MRAPTLSDGTVTLRAYSPDDVPDLVLSMADPTNLRWLSGLPSPYTSADAGDRVEACGREWVEGGLRALAVEVDGRFCGSVELRPTGIGAARIGYELAPWARGRGVMSAAVRLFVRWAFEHWADDGALAPLEVVHWRARVGNWPSRRVAWACGFVVEGRVRLLSRSRTAREDAWLGSLRAGDDLLPPSAWVDVPVVDLGDVVLRPYAASDVPRVASACSDPSTALWLPTLPSPYGEDEARRFLDGHGEPHSRGDALHWALADAAGDELLGAVSITGLEGGTSRTAEIGYWMHPDARGRGVMTRAVRAASRHALLPVADGGLGAHRVVIRAAEPNAASRRVAEKAGFTECGRDRRAEVLRDGRVCDFVRYDLLASELEAAMAHPASLR